MSTVSLRPNAPHLPRLLDHLDDPHLALLIVRILYEDIDNKKYDELLENKILPSISNQFHNNAWEQHMILWLLRKPQDSVNVLLPNNNNNTACKMSDAPEIYAFVSYLNDNEIVKSVREREACIYYISRSCAPEEALQEERAAPGPLIPATITAAHGLSITDHLKHLIHQLQQQFTFTDITN